MIFRLILTGLLFLSGIICAGTIKTVNVSSPGSLSSYFSESDKTDVSTLSVTGTIDARDFAFIRDKVKNLAILNLSSSTIVSYKGSDGPYTDSLITYPAAELPQFAFYNPRLLTYKSTLTTINLPSSIVSIGRFSLYYCWNLTAVTIPSNVKNIADYALYGCYALTNISVASSNTRYSSASGVLFNKNQDTLMMVPNSKTGYYNIPSTVKHIGNSAFENCYQLNTVNFSSSVQSIGSYAFSYCSGITGDLVLPSNLKKIDDGAFYSCSNLTGNVTIPSGVTDIGYYCFFKSDNIKSFSVNTGNQNYASYNDALFSKNLDTLFICPAAKSGTFTVPASLRLIGSYAFYNCKNITGTLLIPALVDYIGYYSFYGCTSLENFEVNSQNQYFLSENGLIYSKTKDRLLICPALKSGTISMASEVKTIDPGAFNNCSKITGYINIPSNVSSIGSYAFYNCSSVSGFSSDDSNLHFSCNEGLLFNKSGDSLYICPLSKSGTLVIPNQVKHIGNFAFDGCVSLTSIYFPPGLESIGIYAFSNCTGLKEIYIPPVSRIYSGAFYGCSSLSTLGIDKNIPPSVDFYTFKNVNQENCKLLTPIGFSGTYKISPYWEEFGQFNEIKSKTSLENSEIKPWKTILYQDKITIDGLLPGQKVKIYTLNGKEVFSRVADNVILNIELQARGIFIVKINGLTEKIIL